MKKTSIFFLILGLSMSLLGCSQGGENHVEASKLMSDKETIELDHLNLDTAPDYQEEELRFRKEFGFDTNVNQNRVQNTSAISKYGVNLTKAEEEEMDARIRFETEQIPKIVNVLEKSTLLQDKIAGMYIDQARGGVFTILINNDGEFGSIGLEELIRKTIKPVFPYDQYIAVKQVDYSEEELHYYQDLVSESKGKLKSKGVDIYSIAPNVFEGVIEIGVFNITPETEDIIKQMLDYERIVVFEVSDIEGITGYVVKKQGDEMLVVEPKPEETSLTGGTKGPYSSFWFSNVPEEIEVGQLVKVWYKGIVMFSDPPQATMSKFEIIPRDHLYVSNLTEAKAIQKALSQDDSKDIMPVIKSVTFNTLSKKWTVVYRTNLHGGTKRTVQISDN